MNFILLFLLIISSIPTFLITEIPLLTYYSIRSQGANRARQLSGSMREYFDHSYDCFYGTFSITPEYTRTCNAREIKNCLFSNQLTPNDEIIISGSQVNDRGNKDWLADYFYLPSDFQSALRFNPHIDNLIVDLNLFLEFNNWLDGLYINFYAPFVNTHWNLALEEKIINKGVLSYQPGYFTPDTTPRKLLNNSFIEYITGISHTPIDQTVTNLQFSTAFRPLQYGLMSTRKHATSRLADIRAQLGYFVVDNLRGQLSTYLHASFPTGNRPEGIFLFEPMIGNGHHWELGFGMSAHTPLLCNQNETWMVDIYADWYITHLFSARQKRFFDLDERPAARYMLAERINVPINGNLVIGATAASAITPTGQFQQDFNPIANLTRISIDSQVSFASEATIFFELIACNFALDLGYNFWIRSTERVKPRGGITDLEVGTTQWAIKGDAQVWGYLAASDPPLLQNQPIALSATEKQATIHQGTNVPQSISLIEAEKNNFIDNPLPAFGGPSITPLLYGPGIPAVTSNQINSSLPIKYLTIQEINLTGGNQRSHSHKLFGHLSYRWIDTNYRPYIGVGGEIEFGKNTHPQCTQINKICSSTFNCALSQWGIWIKGGVTFE